MLLLSIRVRMVTPGRIQGHHAVSTEIAVRIHAQVHGHAVHIRHEVPGMLGVARQGCVERELIRQSGEVVDVLYRSLLRSQ